LQQQLKTYHDEVLARINTIPAIIPEHRKAFKQGFSFSKDSFQKQLPIWNAIWKNNRSFWVRIHAFFFLEQYVTKKELLPAIWQTSVSWQDEVDDWALCDSLAKLNTKALEALPVDVYSQLYRWNKDKNLWKRRQSVVSLLYFSRTKKVYLPFEKISALVEPLLADKEYYVQKSVGWALREMHTVYPAEMLPFLQRHIKEISAIAFTIAIEKMSGTGKDKLKQLRKKK